MINFRISALILLMTGTALAASPPEGTETGTQVPRTQTLNSQTTPTQDLNPTTDKINNTVGATTSGNTTVSGTSEVAPPADNSSYEDASDDSTYDATSRYPMVPIQSVDDQALSTRVQKELQKKFDDYAGYSQQIYSEDGVVTLLGPATSKAQSERFEKAARKVKGVKSVRNKMSVDESIQTR
jgi:hypothetical protein